MKSTVELRVPGSCLSNKEREVRRGCEDPGIVVEPLINSPAYPSSKRALISHEYGESAAEVRHVI